MISQTILELANVRKAYGRVPAVEDISLYLRKGEFLSLLGPSGSGKTTMLSLIAGLLAPSGGDIRIDGKSVVNAPPYRRNIGVVFQNYALFPHMTVAKNVAFPLEMRGIAQAQMTREVRRVLALVDLEDYGERYPNQLSGGQQQRVALARAMVFNPSLLLMDEPLGALDKNMRQQMQLKIMDLHRKHGISIIYVTHDQEEALAMSDRIAVFNKGRLEQIGTPTELYDAPATRFVASFIGETTLLEGRVDQVEGDVCNIDCSGLRVRLRSPHRVDSDSRVVVSIRPERIRVSGRLGASRPDDVNVFEGTVSNIVYLGAHRKVFVDVDARQIVAIDDPRSLDAPYGIGDRVKVRWSDADARIVA
jgi:putative spermidine/putrescine transport system ATP-binding protein